MPDGLLFTCDFALLSGATAGSTPVTFDMVSTANPVAEEVPLTLVAGEIVVNAAATTSTLTTTTTSSTVVTNRSPDCGGAAGVPAALWPPNHGFVDVSIVGVTDPDGDLTSITITAITQDEAVDGCPDATGVGTASASVRAEREGRGDGRVYHIAFMAADDRGGVCTATVSVCTPHDQRGGRTCVDQGAVNDSTQPTCVPACTEGCGIALALAQPPCTEEDLPSPLLRQLHSAQRIISRAASSPRRSSAKGLMRKGIRIVNHATGITAKAMKKGAISERCATSLAAELGDVKTRAEDWLRTR
jgi:hypothetical protein